MHKPKYIWEKKTDQELLFWPDDSYEHYITEAFVPADTINNKSGKKLISQPDSAEYDFFKCRGILSASITLHKKGFYQHRSNADFHVLLYTIKGSATITFSGKKIKVGQGDVFICSAGEEYSIACTNSDWSLFWFHLDKNGNWNKLLKQTQYVKKSQNFKTLLQMINLYSEEIKSKKSSAIVLESYAEIITEFLQREFDFVQSIKHQQISKVIAQMRSSFGKKWTSSLAASKAKVSVKNLNNFCLEHYSESFSKLLLRIRMHNAIALLNNKSIADVAKLVGYSDRFAFTKAFKHFFGKTPVSFL